MTPNNITIGERIVTLRKSKGLTQNDIAEKFQISFQAVSKWERGETLPDISILPELASFLGTTVDSIICVSKRPSKNQLENVQMGLSMTTYGAAAFGCLKAAGLWNSDCVKLMGMTGLSFRFVMEVATCPSSPTIYNWYTEHLKMMDRIGIYSDCYMASLETSPNTYKKIQEDAVKRIKESIDNGVAALIWAPSPVLEFGIAYGYDDERNVYLVRDFTGRQDLTLPYFEFGKSDVAELFYQIFRSGCAIDEQKAYKESLRCALQEWNRDYYPYSGYGSGRKAYLNLINAVEYGNFNFYGLIYNLNVYRDSKNLAALYLKYLSSEAYSLKNLDKAADLFAQLAVKFDKAASILPFGTKMETFEVNKAEFLSLIKGSMNLEDEAMRLIADNFVFPITPSNPG